jgi:hypothetical protein
MPLADGSLLGLADSTLGLFSRVLKREVEELQKSEVKTRLQKSEVRLQK